MVYASFKYKPRKPGGLENHPVVTVQLPIFNERYVISRLMNAVCSIEWPRGRLQIQILDDSSDDTSAMIDDLVEKLRSDGHEIQTLRRETREGFKAGALKNALKHTNRKYIAIFDADFLPPPNFLQATIPLMEEDETLGFVQTRWGHINRNYNKLTETFALGIDGHHIVEQSGRSALGMLMNFNGSCGVLRKKAILDAGGWASVTRGGGPQTLFPRTWT
jgi:cellulose synthase/poly-beta-1,6-N-acetylglucosamine synthase-like glycosyltransferase